MFAYLSGTLSYSSPSLLYMDVGGVGYEVNISLHTYSRIQDATTCKLYTHVQILDDAWKIYGFADEAERDTFRKLISISGVGAGTARVILSSRTPSELEQIISSEDIKTLQSIKGIGAKTAQRIILELKGKLATATHSENPASAMHNTTREDALIALVNLGISKNMAEAAIKKLDNAANLSVEELIKQALRAL